MIKKQLIVKTQPQPQHNHNTTLTQPQLNSTKVGFDMIIGLHHWLAILVLLK